MFKLKKNFKPKRWLREAALPLCLGLMLAADAAGVRAEVNVPAPPPELPQTLREFRTQEQLDESRNDADRVRQYNAEAEEVGVDSAPFVPGDDSAGVVRLAMEYSPQSVVGVPDYGALVLRFFDLQGVPWDIASVRAEHQGFSAEITASPSELLVRQGQGASQGALAVTLEGYDTPLVFSLRPVNLMHDGVRVTTVINHIKIRSHRGVDGYIFPDLKPVPRPHPKASTPHFERQDQRLIEETLKEAVIGLKEDYSER